MSYSIWLSTNVLSFLFTFSIKYFLFHKNTLHRILFKWHSIISSEFHQHSCILKPSIQLPPTWTQCNPHRLIPIVYGTSDSLKYGMICPILIPDINSRCITPILSKVNPTFVIIGKNNLIRLCVEATPPFKLRPGVFGLVRHSLQVEDEQNLGLFGHEVEHTIVVYHALGISVVFRSRSSCKAFVGGPFVSRSIQYAKEGRGTALVQGFPAIALGHEPTHCSEFVIFGDEEDGTVWASVVACHSFISTSISTKQRLPWGIMILAVWIGIHLPTLPPALLLAADPRIPRTQSSAAISIGVIQ
mmetsp:Transcript_8728/g.15187  ORF Transcript_8728/g.15187 Transcript_8728/m.15187 type:complete len:301 (+) Transcript_8728:240-1142(+)